MADTGFIAIGRNIEESPMEESRWEQFVKDILHLLVKCGSKILTHAYGTGVWGEQIEESFVVSFDCDNRLAVEEELSFLAYLYEQRAIAFTVGQTQLVEP